MLTMSRRSKPSKSKNSSFRRHKWRYALPIVAILLFSVIGYRLLFFSSAAPGDKSAGSPIATIAANPPIIATGCKLGINIALVADVSGSIYSNKQDKNEPAEMIQAYSDFVSALLPSTIIHMSLTSFGGSAAINVPLTNNAGTTNTPGSLQYGISHLTEGKGGTNWTDGLAQGFSTINAPGYNTAIPRLLIIATDGDPTSTNNPGPSGGNGDALGDAMAEANIIKAAGVHILAIGLGTDFNLQNLEDISGPNYDTDATTVSVETDVTSTAFSNLSAALVNIANNSSGCDIGNNGGGNGNNGNGNGNNGNGNGNNGNGNGNNGNGNGSTPSPSPSPAPSAPAGATPSPTPTPTPSPQKSPAPAAEPSSAPNPAPEPTAQGTQTKPPTPQPSPFYDGKQYTPGSAADNATITVNHHIAKGWWYGLVVLLVAIPTGFLVWRKQTPATKTASNKKRPKTRK